MTKETFYLKLKAKGVTDITKAKALEAEWLASGHTFDKEAIGTTRSFASEREKEKSSGYFDRMSERIDKGIEQKAEKAVESQRKNSSGLNVAASNIRGGLGSMNVVLGNLPGIYEGGQVVGKGVQVLGRIVPGPAKRAASAVASGAEATYKLMPEEAQNVLGTIGEGVILAGSATGLAKTPAAVAKIPQTVGKTALGTARAAQTAATAAGGAAVKTGKAIGKAFTPKLSLPELAVDVRRKIKTGVLKGIRPSGIKSSGALRQYLRNSTKAVNAIDDHLPELNILDDAGNAVTTITNRAHLMEAVDQTKNIVYKQYDDMQRAATVADVVRFDTKPVVEALNKITESRKYDSSIKRYAARMADEMDDLAGATAEDVQARIQQYNASLTGFQSGLNVSQVKAQVEGTVASLLRDQLDDMVTKGAGKAGYQDLKNTYSALRTIEKDVARQAMNQLSDKNAMATFTHLITGERLISSAVLGRPDLLGRALSMEGAGRFLKWYTGPDRKIKAMFDSVRQAKRAGIKLVDDIPSSTSAPASTVSAKAAEAAQPNLKVPTYKRQGLDFEPEIRKAAAAREAKRAEEAARARRATDVGSWHKLGDTDYPYNSGY
jgi:hypothetical protein